MNGLVALDHELAVSEKRLSLARKRRKKPDTYKNFELREATLYLSIP